MGNRAWAIPFFSSTQSAIHLPQQASHVSVSPTLANCPPALQVSNSMRRDGGKMPCALSCPSPAE